jgi:hypothetical protein
VLHEDRRELDRGRRLRLFVVPRVAAEPHPEPREQRRVAVVRADHRRERGNRRLDLVRQRSEKRWDVERRDGLDEVQRVPHVDAVALRVLKESVKWVDFVGRQRCCASGSGYGRTSEGSARKGRLQRALLEISSGGGRIHIDHKDKRKTNLSQSFYTNAVEFAILNVFSNAFKLK